MGKNKFKVSLRKYTICDKIIQKGAYGFLIFFEIITFSNSVFIEEFKKKSLKNSYGWKRDGKTKNIFSIKWSK